MDNLIAGIRTFRRDVHTSKSQLFASLATQQTPTTLFLTCSDSRVVPNLITGTEPGDLFVMRNAGNIVAPFGTATSGEEATVEYAVNVLNVQDIIVCGHSGCGAMTALLNPDAVTKLPSVGRWLESAQSTRAVVDATISADAPLQERLARTVEINALRQLDNLRTHPSVAAALAKNVLKVHAWVYDIGSGSVSGYNDTAGEFVELNAVDPTTS